MADRDLNIKVMVSNVPGQDTVSPVLDDQKRKVEALQAAAAKPLALSPGPDTLTPALDRAIEKVDALRAKAEKPIQLVAAPLQTATAAPTAGDLQGAQTRALAQLESERQQRLTEAARARITGGFIPANRVTVVGGQAEGGAAVPGGAARGLGQVAGGAATAVATGNAGGLAPALAAAAGAAGGAGAALGGVVAAVSPLLAVFESLRFSVAQASAEFQRSRDTLERGRATGAPTAAGIRAALSGPEQAGYAAAEESGSTAVMRAILQNALTRERERVAAMTGAGGRVATAQAVLDAAETLTESTAYRLNPLAPSRAIVRQLALRHAGFTDLPDLPTGRMTPGERRDLALTLGGGGAAGAAANVEALTNALRPGMLPTLRPGGLTLADLPQIFQSRQGDVLDMHAEIQRDLVRDLREQARFERQMQVWEEIMRNTAALPALAGGGSPGPDGLGAAVGGVGAWT